jgi:osmotically-inducible protein OsmY
MKTDLELRHAVTDELERDAAIDAERIGVEVCDGVVTLSGHLPDFAQKIAAEQAAQRVPGVEMVVIELDIHRPSMLYPSDAELAREVADALHHADGVVADAIRVQIEKGWVLLTGSVATPSERSAAERAASTVKRITGITNGLRVAGAPRSAGAGIVNH